MPRRYLLQESDNHERWLVSYSDFMTLLFAFFVVMYAISSVNEGKYRILSDTLMQSFAPDALSLKPIQLGEPVQATPHNAIPLGKMADHTDDLEGNTVLESFDTKLKEQLEGFLDKDAFAISGDELWLQVDLESGVLFNSGSAKLSNRGRELLEAMVKSFRGMKNPITVEGYTDNVPTQGERYVSNWELSAARATAVVRGFVDIGIEPERLAAVGYGEYHPVATNATPEGREKNRRVTIIIARDADVQRGLTALSATRSKPVPLLWEDEAGAAETQDSDSSDSVSAIRREGGGLLFTAPAAERENHSNDKNQGR